jgi:hypothetical protein
VGLKRVGIKVVGVKRVGLVGVGYRVPRTRIAVDLIDVMNTWNLHNWKVRIVIEDD